MFAHAYKMCYCSLMPPLTFLSSCISKYYSMQCATHYLQIVNIVSRLAYTFSYIVNEARSPNNTLQIPNEIMAKYQNKRLDVRKLNGGHGLSFKQIYNQFAGQMEELRRVKAVEDYDEFVIEKLKAIADRTETDTLFLEVFDSLDEKYEWYVV